jgi:hypothetical protein
MHSTSESKSGCQSTRPRLPDRPRLPAKRQVPVAEVDPAKETFKRDRRAAKERWKKGKGEWNESANPELDAVYAKPAAQEKMLRLMGINVDHSDWSKPYSGDDDEDEISTVMQSKSFPCVVRGEGNAFVKWGKDDRITYGMFKPDSNDPMPIFLTLVDAYARARHGFDADDPQLLNPYIYASYKALLAARSGAVKIKRIPLPWRLPDDVLKVAKTIRQVRLLEIWVIYFWEKVNCAREFVREGFDNANECVMFSITYRKNWFPHTGPDAPPVKVSQKRMGQLWKLLLDSGLIDKVEKPRRTLYRIGSCDLQDRYDEQAFKDATEKRFEKLMDKTRRTISNAVSELDEGMA